MNYLKFVEEISSIKLENVFNPYSDICSKYDNEDAAQERKRVLFNFLEAASKIEVDSIWLGRDLGYRGGRRTGIALTDEIKAPYFGERWGVKVPRFTHGQAVSERTATVIWDMLDIIDKNIFLWNAFPLHPHNSGKPFSNRSHNARERRLGEEILSEIVNIIRPNRIVAIGNDAEISAKRLFSESRVIKFRHPSYGGKNIFIKQVEDLYKTFPKFSQGVLV